MALFDIRELVNMAIQDEETGIAFYKALAGKTRLPHIQSEVIDISKQEEAHAKRFRGMLRTLGDYKPSEPYAGQYGDYLSALLETRAFPNPEAAAAYAKSAKDDAAAIEMAMRLEKETLNFLQMVRSVVPPVNSEMVDAIMAEERHHLVELARMKKTLT